MSHTPEPWSIEKENCHTNDVGTCHGEDGWFTILSEGWWDHMPPVSAEANARRIVACVNACAGTSTSWLIGYGDGLHKTESGKPIRENLEAIVSQRDELLAALKSLNYSASHDSYNAKVVREAIAKAVQP